MGGGEKELVFTRDHGRRGSLSPLLTGLTYCENNIFVAQPTADPAAACLCVQLPVVIAAVQMNWEGTTSTDWLQVTPIK